MANLTEKRELATLIRIDGRQAALVNAKADASVITPHSGEAADSRTGFIPWIGGELSGAQESKGTGGARDERAMLATLGVLVPLALLAMYALMAGLLRSYWKPLVCGGGHSGGAGRSESTVTGFSGGI